MFDGQFRQAVDRTTKPVGAALVKVGVTADVLTVFGLVMSVISALVVGSGHLVWGVAMLFAVGLPDLFDGPVAKASGRASVRGAFFDSVADRISDAFLYGGVALYLVNRHHGRMVLLPMAILAVTSLISYERAKAEQLGLSARGGLMERAERFILLGVVYLAGAVSAAAFVPALWVFFGLVTATAVGRFVRVWQLAEGPSARTSRRALFRTRSYERAQRRSDTRFAQWREARARAERERAGSGEPLGPRAERWGERWGGFGDRLGVRSGSRPMRSAGKTASQGRTVRSWRDRRAMRAADGTSRRRPRPGH